MIKKAQVLLLFLVLLVGGCTSHKIVKKPQCNLRTFNESINIDVTRPNYEQQEDEEINVVRDMKKALKDELISNAFDIDNTQESLKLNVKIDGFTPGNQAVRLLVGWGAGKAVLRYSASFYDQEDNLLGKFSDDLQFGGMDMEVQGKTKEVAAFNDQEKVTKLMTDVAAKRIVRFALLKELED